MHKLKRLIQPFISFVIFFIVFNNSLAQFGHPVKWSNDGNSYYRTRTGSIVMISLPDAKETVIVPSEKLIPQGASSSLSIQNFSFSIDNQKILNHRRYRLRLGRSSFLYRRLIVVQPGAGT